MTTTVKSESDSEGRALAAAYQLLCDVARRHAKQVAALKQAEQATRSILHGSEDQATAANPK